MQDRPSTAVTTFLAVTFSVSWALGLVFWAVGGGPIAKVVLGVAYMFGPLLGAVAAQRSAGQPVLAPLGGGIGKPGAWWLVAWLGPFAYAWLALGIALLFPGVSLSLDLTGLWERMAASLPPDQIEEARAQMDAVPPAVFWLALVVQPLIAGPTINALAAYGEELGWRGFLHTRWAGWGFWRSALATGFVWGVWHAPLVAQGHNYPEHPIIGVAMMTVWCMLLAPPFHYVRLRTGSVVAAAVMHGTLNACAGIALLFLDGGSDLLVGVTGLAGMLALVVPNALILAFDRDPS
ncbi:MAG: CPBP family intramembrane metalloprotease [Alphaproteobacteria bacterium]|nr:CPBP family intramembrane metalloprotease [Alphaproteobacteria bacterium]